MYTAISDTCNIGKFITTLLLGRIRWLCACERSWEPRMLQVGCGGVRFVLDSEQPLSVDELSECTCDKLKFNYGQHWTLQSSLFRNVPIYLFGPHKSLGKPYYIFWKNVKQFIYYLLALLPGVGLGYNSRWQSSILLRRIEINNLNYYET